MSAFEWVCSPCVSGVMVFAADIAVPGGALPVGRTCIGHAIPCYSRRRNRSQLPPVSCLLLTANPFDPFPSPTLLALLRCLDLLGELLVLSRFAWADLSSSRRALVVSNLSVSGVVEGWGTVGAGGLVVT